MTNRMSAWMRGAMSAMGLLFGAAVWAGDDIKLPRAEGCNGAITQQATLANGDLVVVGYFSACGNVWTRGVARYDGQRWWPLDVRSKGLNGSAQAIAVAGNDVYIAGSFNRAGGVVVSNIVRFDGTQWHALGAGTEQPAYALAMFNGELYASGYFFIAGEADYFGLARWNGSAWRRPPAPDGQPFSGVVDYLTVFRDELYVSSFLDFSVAGRTLNAAKLTATGWQPLAGLPTRGFSARFSNPGGDALYALLNIQTSNILFPSELHRFDGRWSRVVSFRNGQLESVALLGSDLHIAGRKLLSHTFSGSNDLLRYRDGVLTGLAAGSGASQGDRSVALQLFNHRGSLYFSGQFSSLGGVAVSNIARLQGDTFVPLWQGGDDRDTQGIAAVADQVQAVAAAAN